ncbi:MAG: serine/threonine protein kinase, partial [Eubacterium sp.]|nr:serine/threonine protein kinase [Eubacterium sp.]
MTIEDAYKLSCYKELMQLDSKGNVYLTRHIETGSIFVRKTLPAYTKELYKALISYKKNNPASHIPAIIETFADDEKIHVIEEYIEGRTLGQIMDEDPLTEKEIAHFIIELCDILSGLHSVDPPIIHRDIKPSNLIINTDGSLYLIDFDSAKQYNEDRNEDTVLLGTRGYAAPEQYGFGQSTPRTDIYGIGALMLSLLTNKAKDGSKYNGMLRPIIDKCMSMDPNDRYADTALVKQSLILTISSGRYEQGSTPTRSKASDDEFIILRSLYKNPYLPVGFRTGTIWKMLVGSSVYVLFL